MKRTPGERTRHSPQDEKAQAMLRRRKFRKGTTNTTRKTRQKARETRDNAPEEEDTAREKQNNFPNGAAILGGRSLEKGDHPGRILHNPSLEKRQRESCGTQLKTGVAKSIGNHADEDGDQRAEAEEQQIGQAALIRMEGQLRRGKAQQGQSIADMKDRERRRIVTLHNNSGSKEE
ncbi:hypothetical protein C8F01DRAFT_1082960 [Mycena amicta]|nr:hypothetical protein C8F01DRAFT_1082960 [Mycena amicta]